MADRNLEITAPNGSFGVAVDFQLGGGTPGDPARFMRLQNRATVPVSIRYTDGTGAEIVRLQAAGQTGDTRNLQWQTNQGPTAIAANGNGGTGPVTVDVTTEERRHGAQPTGSST